MLMSFFTRTSVVGSSGGLSSCGGQGTSAAPVDDPKALSLSFAGTLRLFFFLLCFFLFFLVVSNFLLYAGLYGPVDPVVTIAEKPLTLTAPVSTTPESSAAGGVVLGDFGVGENSPRLLSPSRAPPS